MRVYTSDGSSTEQPDVESPDPQTGAWDLRLSGIHKTFGPIVALSGVEFGARFGEVHALLGENGAGKSTFVRILSGVTRPDAGDIYLDGRKLQLNHPIDGIRAGIGTVFQELSLIPDLSVAANLFFQREDRSRMGAIDRRALLQRAEHLLADLELPEIRPTAEVGTLPIAQQQLVEIAKVLARQPRVLILDEATSSLPQFYAAWLFNIVRQLTATGTGVIFISHRMHEVTEIADRITIFRGGTTVASGPCKDFSEDDVVEHMLGRRLKAAFPDHLQAPTDSVVLRVADLNLGRALHDINLEVRAGEILGIGGLQGQGQMALLLSLYGWYRAQGRIEVDGNPLRLHSPADALHHGIALVPEDRRSEGLLQGLSIRENLALPILSHLSMLGLVRPSRERALAWRIVDQLHIRASSLEQEVNTLSGGNQQKVMIGKLMTLNVRVLLLADITRGVDVGAKAELYALVQSLAAEGKAVLFYSSDSQELVSLCHGVAIMHDHTISTILTGAAQNEENVVRAYLGANAQRSVPG